MLNVSGKDIKISWLSLNFDFVQLRISKPAGDSLHPLLARPETVGSWEAKDEKEEDKEQGTGRHGDMSWAANQSGKSAGSLPPVRDET